MTSPSLDPKLKARIDQAFLRLAQYAGGTPSALRNVFETSQKGALGPWSYLLAVLDGAWCHLGDPARLTGKRGWLKPLWNRPKAVEAAMGPDVVDHAPPGGVLIFWDDYPAAAEKILKQDLCQALRPAARKKHRPDVLCLVRPRAGAAGEVYEVLDVPGKDCLRRLGANAAEFLEREVAVVLGEATDVEPKPVRKAARARVTSVAAAPTAGEVVAAWLGAEVLQGFSLQATQPNLQGFKGSGGFLKRIFKVGNVEVEAEVHLRDKVVHRIESSFIVKCAGLDELLASLAAPLLAALEARFGAPQSGRTFKKGDGEWKWKTDSFYATAVWRIRKDDRGAKAFEPLLGGRVFVASWGG